MATRKKKSDVLDVIQKDPTFDDWPKVVKGSHLTVITHKSGKTELVWDDVALLRDVKEAMSEFKQELSANIKNSPKKKTMLKQNDQATNKI